MDSTAWRALTRLIIPQRTPLVDLAQLGTIVQTALHIHWVVPQERITQQPDLLNAIPAQLGIIVQRTLQHTWPRLAQPGITVWTAPQSPMSIPARWAPTMTRLGEAALMTAWPVILASSVIPLVYPQSPESVTVGGTAPEGRSPVSRQRMIMTHLVIHATVAQLTALEANVWQGNTVPKDLLLQHLVLQVT